MEMKGPHSLVAASTVDHGSVSGILGRPIKSGDDSNGLAAACLRPCAIGEMKIVISVIASGMVGEGRELNGWLTLPIIDENSSGNKKSRIP
jgi:hypothetical protein